MKRKLKPKIGLVWPGKICTCEYKSWKKPRPVIMNYVKPLFIDAVQVIFPNNIKVCVSILVHPRILLIVFSEDSFDLKAVRFCG